MIVPIRCFTCAKVIADKYDYYVEEKQKLEKSNAKNDNPDYKFYSDIHTKDILDKLGLTRYCCRRMLLSAGDMMDII